MEPARPKQDSGLIDLFAIQHEAQLAQAAADAAAEAEPSPSSVPTHGFTRDTNADLEAFATGLNRSWWSTLSRKTLALSGAGLVLAFVAIISLGGNKGDAKHVSGKA